ncbi:MAG: caspase family protein [Anaerolineae bacterium]|nr:caspase family protein [Anaerolineae bacterium]
MTTFERGHALVVGVGGDLPGSVRDAEGLASVLAAPDRGAYAPDRVRLLTGEAATREGVLAALDALARACDDQSTLLFYFSGHVCRVVSSTGEFTYLLTHGFDAAHLYRTAIGGAELADALQVIPARRMLALLDGCHAGEVGAAAVPAGLEMARVALPTEVRALAGGSGRAVLASSRDDELSQAGQPYSAFARALIEALCGAGATQWDGFVRVADLAAYVGEVVPRWTLGRQHPLLCAERADNFAVAYYAGGAAEPTGASFAAGGDAVDLRGSQGAVIAPAGPVEQHFGDRYDIHDVSGVVDVQRIDVRIGDVSDGGRVKIGAQDEGRTCPACGHPVRPGARFCNRCGAKV